MPEKKTVDLTLRQLQIFSTVAHAGSFTRAAKQLEMIQEIRPALTRVAVLGDPRINDRQLRATEAVAVRLGVTLHAFALTEPKAIPELVAEAARQKAGALVALTSPLVSVRMKTLADTAVTHGLPTVCAFTHGFAEAGGLIAYGPDPPELFRCAAGHVVKILKGVRPADLPIQRPTKFSLVINVKTAKALGSRSRRRCWRGRIR